MTHVKTRNDLTFPTLHGRPPMGWLNDPNGCGRIDGTWHVFYQYNPSAPVHANIHWGHMSSTDLVRWRTEDIALTPRPGSIDSAGCWTGCLVDHEGIPTLVYSAIADDTGASTVALARSDRTLRKFRQDETPVIAMPQNPALTDVRDPYVFTLDGHRYAVQGAGSRHGVGRLLLYGCDDLSAWVELGTLLRSDHPVVAEVAGANIWECPNLVPLGDGWLLVVSILRGHKDGHALSHVCWVYGDLIRRRDGLSFEPRSAGRLDDGPAFYAPQLTGADGRTLMWGWAWELERTAEEVERAGWAGVLTFARELRMDGDRLQVESLPELDRLRAEPIDLTKPLPSAFVVDVSRGESVMLHLDGQACWPVDLTVHRVFVDGSLIEVFTADGGCYTTRAYPTREHPFLIDASLDHLHGVAMR